MVVGCFFPRTEYFAEVAWGPAKIPNWDWDMHVPVIAIRTNATMSFFIFNYGGALIACVVFHVGVLAITGVAVKIDINLSKRKAKVGWR
jgi:hypothetical protein